MSGAQLALNLAPVARRRARRTDPATSRDAARRAGAFAESHAGRILAALREHGPATAHELEPLVGLSYVQIDRRVGEMRRARLIEAQTDGGGEPVTRVTPSGGRAQVWMAV